MGKFDIEPSRGVTDPEFEHFVRQRGKSRKKDIKRNKSQKRVDEMHKNFLADDFFDEENRQDVVS